MQKKIWAIFITVSSHQQLVLHLLCMYGGFHESELLIKKSNKRHVGSQVLQIKFESSWQQKRLQN